MQGDHGFKGTRYTPVDFSRSSELFKAILMVITVETVCLSAFAVILAVPVTVAVKLISATVSCPFLFHIAPPLSPAKLWMKMHF